jgi:hypothetical protein
MSLGMLKFSADVKHATIIGEGLFWISAILKKDFDFPNDPLPLA